jgi:hypothetical protein
VQDIEASPSDASLGRLSMTSTNLQVTRRRFLSFSLPLFAAVAIPVVSWLSKLSMLTSLALVLASVSVWFPVLYYRSLYLSAFHPYSYLVFNSTQTFLIPAVLFIDFRYGSTPLTSLTQAILLIGAAHAFVAMGFLLPIGRRLGRRVPLLRWQGKATQWHRFIPMAASLYAIGWVARIQRGALGFSHLPGEYTTTQTTISFLGDLDTMATLGYLVLIARVFQRRVTPLSAMVAAILVGLEMLAGALVGGRTGIVLPIAYALLAWWWSGHRVRVTTLVLFYLIALLLVGPLLTGYRLALYDLLENGSASSLTVVSAAAAATPSMIAREGGFAELRRATIIQRAPTFESSLRVLDRVPNRYAFEWGRNSIEDVATLLVPRALWPGKPVYEVGQRRASEFWDINPQTSGGTNIGIGMPSELFLNFGWWGLPLFIVFGGLLRFSASWLERLDGQNVSRLVLTAFVAIFVSHLDQDFPGYVVGMLRSATVYFAFLTVLHGHLPRISFAPTTHVHRADNTMFTAEQRRRFRGH